MVRRIALHDVDQFLVDYGDGRSHPSALPFTAGELQRVAQEGITGPGLLPGSSTARPGTAMSATNVMRSA